MTREWLVRYSEIFLKSDPVRRKWEQILIRNIRDVLPGCRARHERGRIWLTGDVDPRTLQRVFGIASFSEVEHVPLRSLGGILLDYCRDRGIDKGKTFAIRVKRIGNHPFSSHDKAIEYGNLIRTAFPHLKVNLANPEREIFIEIRNEEGYVYDFVIQGLGGLPLGVEGTLVALMSGGIDSPVAAWMMMRRGCRIIPLYVALDDILDESNLERAERVVDALRIFQPDLLLVPLKDTYLSRAHNDLLSRGLEKYTCIVCKRRMYRIAEAYAHHAGAKGIVTGESLGQVASQTLDNLLVLDAASSIPVYRPLIGFDKEDTIRIAREIGTFIPSTMRASACSAVPSKPSTNADLMKIEAIEKGLADSPVPPFF
ncbi:MAG: thiamine biosynthesis protein ThiI [Methanoregulaceae archaeon PtaB.Bin108]|nr:MAG: thiamine biosynthesis protein ThiI [Methanoregulaceae archaeon PtaB.Bin108]OPY46425.1 MAG: thiamine biosynthesis protein ThiI [Methanoregulaceae archaeon PtaU1.Bin222]